MAEYNKKWADLFPATIGNQNRPAAGVDNTLPYETDKFPQHIANDPVRYDKMNAVVSQSMSNDERLNEKIKRTSDDLAAHNKDPKAHATGIAGNAATATKLQTPRALSLTGKAAGSATFDGSANASINVTSVNADTASKLSTARKINITGNATGSATFDGSGNVSINTTVSQATAANALNSMGDKTAIKDGTREPAGLNLYKVYNNGYPVSYGNLLSIGGAGGGELLAEWSGGDKGIGHLYYRNRRDAGNLWSDWRTVAFTSDINSFAPTKTGSGASGTWPISISGNAATATIATTTNSLNEALDRPASANVTYNDGKIRYFLATSNMSEGKPPGGDGPVIHLSWDKPLWETQIAINNPSGHIQTRGQDMGTWGSWKTVLDSDNFNNYAPTKTGGGASGTWGISISGNANTASSVAWSGVTGKPGTYPPSAHNHDSAYPSVTGTRASGTWGINISGNADSATNADTVDGYHASDIINKISAANTGGIVAASLTENGYVKFANGLILQWGYVGSAKSHQYVTCSYPIGFNSVLAVFCTMIGQCTVSGDNGSFNLNWYNNKQANFYNTDDRDGTGFFWFAIGN